MLCRTPANRIPHSPYDSSSNLNLPNGIAVDLNDVAWVGNEGNGTVVGVNLSGGSTQLLYGPIATNETAGELLGAAVDGSNNIWFAGYGNGTYPANVYELVPQPTFSNGYSINYYDNSGLYGPYNLAIDASGDAWAANYAAASIIKLTPATGGTGRRRDRQYVFDWLRQRTPCHCHRWEFQRLGDQPGGRRRFRTEQHRNTPLTQWRIYGRDHGQLQRDRCRRRE